MQTRPQTYVLTGTVIALSQLATCGPELSKRAGKTDPKPIPIMLNGRGAFMYMPGAGLRSKLRGCATAIIREALRDRDMKLLSLADAQLLRVGGVKQAGQEAALDAKERAEMLRKNPLLAVFGGSTPWVEGRLMVGNLLCQQPIEKGVFEPLVIDGVRADILRRDPDMVQFLTLEAVGEYQSTIDRVKAYAAIKGNVADLERQARAAPDASSRKSLRAQADALLKGSVEQAVVSAQMPLTGYKAIPQGALLNSALRLRNASLIEIGCLLAALRRFALDPFIGAHLAHGAGEISATWDVRVAGQPETAVIRLVPFEGLQIEEPGTDKPLAVALAEFDDFIAKGDLEPWVNAAALVAGADDEATE